jgi:hypothetical protein
MSQHQSPLTALRDYFCAPTMREFRGGEPSTVASKLETPIQFARKISPILLFVTVFPTLDILARLIPGLTPTAS